MRRFHLERGSNLGPLDQLTSWATGAPGKIRIKTFNSKSFYKQTSILQQN